MNAQVSKVPDAVIRRMPKYYRYLQEMERMGRVRVSSAKMSKDIGLNASQIRRDLNCFGGFGQQGYGYNVASLKAEVEQILGLGRQYNMVIFGAGNIGQALLNYANFEKRGFSIAGMFDVSKELVGKQFGNVVVRHVSEFEEFARTVQVHIGVIATPKEAAQQVADMLVKAGVEGIWNYSPAYVQGKGHVAVETVHLNDSLYVLCYRMAAERDE